MRLTPIALSVAIALATMASAGHGQKPDDQLDPRSVALTQQAYGLQANGRYQEAVDLFESALAVDPRNRRAFIGLARVAQSQNLPGKAIRLYGQALQLEPNDIEALAGQGTALVQRGAVDRAKTTLERVRSLCSNACPEAATLAAAIAKGPPLQAQAAKAPEPPAPAAKN